MVNKICLYNALAVILTPQSALNCKSVFTHLHTHIHSLVAVTPLQGDTSSLWALIMHSHTGGAASGAISGSVSCSKDTLICRQQELRTKPAEFPITGWLLTWATAAESLQRMKWNTLPVVPNNTKLIVKLSRFLDVSTPSQSLCSVGVNFSLSI